MFNQSMMAIMIADSTVSFRYHGKSADYDRLRIASLATVDARITTGSDAGMQFE